MADLRKSRNLALEIGLYRIALVVNRVFKQMKNHTAFAALFDVSVSHDDEACLTYFWWVVLGGNKLSDLDSEVIRGCAWMGISSTLFREWLALFRQTALPIIGAKLTDAWMLRALPLAHEFPVTGDGDAVQLAQGTGRISEIQDAGSSSQAGSRHSKGIPSVVAQQGATQTFEQPGGSNEMEKSSLCFGWNRFAVCKRVIGTASEERL